jgi:hypothetical protein
MDAVRSYTVDAIQVAVPKLMHTGTRDAIDRQVYISYQQKYGLFNTIAVRELERELQLSVYIKVRDL